MHVTPHWRWIKADWQKPRKITAVRLEFGGQAVGALQVEDLSGPRYFAGPLVEFVVTEYPTLEAAQAAPFPLPADGYVLLPNACTAAVVTLHHRAAGTDAYQVRGFLPGERTTPPVE